MEIAAQMVLPVSEGTQSLGLEVANSHGVCKCHYAYIQQIYLTDTRVPPPSGNCNFFWKEAPPIIF